MATTRFFLDTRNLKSDVASLKVAIAHQHQTSYIKLEARLTPDQWDAKTSRVVNHPDQARLNVYISGVMQQVNKFVLNLADDGRLSTMTAKQIRDYIEQQMKPEKVEEKRNENLFAARFLRFGQSKSPSTRRLYNDTYKRMREFAGKGLDTLAFEDITKEWLVSFDNYMVKQSPSRNARNIHLRNIRAVFNEAIDDEVTTFYPFRRFTIRNVATRKRNLKVEDLRKLFTFPCEKHAQQYLDIFKLMFMLLGINIIDLCNLKEIDNEGRINFYRA